jgi:hypothetical protein
MIFHWEFYLHKYNDLRENGLLTEEDALNHWLNYGMKELRIFNDIPLFFDWKNYLDQNPDLKDIKNEEEAWRHFLYFGVRENRKLRHKTVLKIYCLK